MSPSPHRRYAVWLISLAVVSALGFGLSGVLGVWLLWGVVRSGRI